MNGTHSAQEAEATIGHKSTTQHGRYDILLITWALVIATIVIAFLFVSRHFELTEDLGDENKKA
jgi:hypothetical protein